MGSAIRPRQMGERHMSYVWSVIHCILTHRSQRLPKRDDLTPLTDPMWIAKILSEIPSEVSQEVGAGTKWRGLGTKIEVATLA